MVGGTGVFLVLKTTAMTMTMTMTTSRLKAAKKGLARAAVVTTMMTMTDPDRN